MYFNYNYIVIHSSYHGIGDPNQNQSEPDIDLDCGRPVSFSYYDDLIGISLRYSHPMVPDPEVSQSDYMLLCICKSKKTIKIKDYVLNNYCFFFFFRPLLHLSTIGM